MSLRVAGTHRSAYSLKIEKQPNLAGDLYSQLIEAYATAGRHGHRYDQRSSSQRSFSVQIVFSRFVPVHTTPDVFARRMSAMRMSL